MKKMAKRLENLRGLSKIYRK